LSVALVGATSVSISARQPVSEAAYGMDPARTAGIVTEGATQGHDMVVHFSQRGFGFEPADLFDDVGPRHHLAATQNEDLEHEDVVRS